MSTYHYIVVVEMCRSKAFSSKWRVVTNRNNAQKLPLIPMLKKLHTKSILGQHTNEW